MIRFSSRSVHRLCWIGMSFSIPNSHQPLLEHTIAAHPERCRFVGVFPSRPDLSGKSLILLSDISAMDRHVWLTALILGKV
jgi:hypothetical protein